MAESHHFYDLHHSINTEMIEECGQVLFHLDTVIVQLGHSEDAHLAFPPNLRSKNNPLLPVSVRVYAV